jgi:P2-related tail formation protein
MSTVVDVGLRPRSDLATDQYHAERLLSQLAIELRRVPVDERTCALHLRALALKRAVMRWSEDQPDESLRRAIVDEVRVMQDTALDWQRIWGKGRSGAGVRHMGE